MLLAQNRVAADLAGAALVVRTEADDPAPLARLAAALPSEPDRVPVLLAASACARPDLADLLPDLLGEHLGGSGDGVRLVPLGRYPAGPAKIVAAARAVADRTGTDITVPVTAPVSDLDGELFVAGWVVAAADGSVRPAGPWRRPGPADPAWRQTRVGTGYGWLPTAPAGPATHPPAGARPRIARVPTVPAATVEPAPGRRTPAGLSLLSPDGAAEELGPVRSGWLVEVAAGAGGFRIAGRPAAPAALGRLLRSARPRGAPPTVLLVRGDAPTGRAAELLYAGVVDAFGRPVVTVTGPVSRLRTGTLVTTGEFQRWLPRQAMPAANAAGGGPRVRSIGSTYPPPPLPASRIDAPETALAGRRLTMARPSDVALAAQRPPQGMAVTVAPTRHETPSGQQPPPETPVSAALPAPVDAGLRALLTLDRWTATAAAPPPHTEPPKPPPTASAAPAVVTGADGTGAGREPIWVDGADLSDGDALALRRVLDGRYDTHARGVNQTLATEPGLRVVALTAPALPAGLVAVRAYCATERESINSLLRGAGDREAADVTVLARCVAYGLRRLPAIFGAVFRSATALPVAGYRPGMVLVEPAFLDVDRAPRAGRRDEDEGADRCDGGEAGEAEFVIWSASARRPGSLAPRGDAAGPEPAGSPAAIFPAGTTFRVLAVDPPDRDGRHRIYLREIPAGRPGTGDDKILARLRDAVAAGAGPEPGMSPPLRTAPGFDGAGRPFAPRDDEPAAKRRGTRDKRTRDERAARGGVNDGSGWSS